ncbi:hypothetical protein BN1723_020204, partial [Verticillium longisporum]
RRTRREHKWPRRDSDRRTNGEYRSCTAVYPRSGTQRRHDSHHALRTRPGSAARHPGGRGRVRSQQYGQQGRRRTAGDVWTWRGRDGGDVCGNAPCSYGVEPTQEERKLGVHHAGTRV